MKKKASKSEFNSAKRHSWRTLIGVVTVTLLLVGIVTALSKQNGQTQKPQVTPTQMPQLEAQLEGRKPAMAKETHRHYVTSNAAGQTVVLDRQTGQTRPLSLQEQTTLAEGLKQIINQSTDGLVQVQHADGMVSMDLQGHFQSAMLAKREADGTISQSCVDNVDSAAAFFDIDPALLGSTAPASKTQAAPTKLADR